MSYFFKAIAQIILAVTQTQMRAACHFGFYQPQMPKEDK
jgi:cyclic lactone autoinducer peptide